MLIWRVCSRRQLVVWWVNQQVSGRLQQLGRVAVEVNLLVRRMGHSTVRRAQRLGIVGAVGPATAPTTP